MVIGETSHALSVRTPTAHRQLQNTKLPTHVEKATLGASPKAIYLGKLLRKTKLTEFFTIRTKEASGAIFLK